MLQSTTQPSVVRNAQWQSVKNISFSPGHIFHGRITKIFPNNLAALSVNGIALTARLEAALSAGQSYWFQVEEGSGIPRLRVLDDNSVRQREGLPAQPSSHELVRQLGLPQTKAIDMLVRQFSSQQLPFSKESILAGAELLSQLNRTDKEALQLLQGMMHRQLPLTKETFHAYQAVQQNLPLSEQLQQVIRETAQASQPASQQLSDAVSRFLNETQMVPTRSPISELLMMFSSNRYSEEMRHGAEQLLHRLGLIEKGVTREQIYENFRQAFLQPENRATIQQLWPNLNSSGQGFEIASLDGKAFFEMMMSRLTIPAGREGTAQLQQLLQLFRPGLEAEQVQKQWLQTPNMQLQANERLAVQQALEQTVLQTRTAGQERSSIAAHVQNLLQALGYGHENDIVTQMRGDFAKETVQAERLKAALLSIQQQELPLALKEQVNQLIHRITGQQILSHEQSGPLHHVAIQIPLSFGLFQTDMTMHWEGKKTKEGQLDASHCRILFYLTLEALNETIVDVQIQNRIMAVTIFNERERPESLIQLLLPSLKEALANHQYQLSTFSWKEMKDVNAPQTKAKDAYQQQVGYQGVDVRI